MRQFSRRDQFYPFLLFDSFFNHSRSPIYIYSVYIYIYMHRYACKYIRVHACVYVCVYIYIYICIYTYVCVCMCAYIYARRYIMHAHVQRQLSSSEGERLNRDRERERGERFWLTCISADVYVYGRKFSSLYIYIVVPI